MTHSATLFPRPPPTHNTLTLAERSQLLRSNAKIGQLLGSTPHVIDDVFPVVARDRTARRRSLPASKSHQTAESPSPASLSGSTLDLASRSSCESSSSTVSSVSTSWSTTPLDSERSWRIPFSPSCRPPLLRIGKSLSRSTSRSSSRSSSSSSSPPSPETDIRDERAYTWSGRPDHCDIDFDLDAVDSAPTFAIPSATALRRQKMVRIRKRLGADVPVHLVFPSAVESVESDEEGGEEGMGEKDGESMAEEKREEEQFCAVRSSTAVACQPVRPQPHASAIFKPDPRRSHLAAPSPSFAPVTQQCIPDTWATKPRVMAVHYASTGTHGFESETFKGLTFTCRRITTIPEE